MKKIKATIQLHTEQYNNQPDRNDMMKLLDPLHKIIRYVDVIDRDYWSNRNDTLVFELDCEEVARFGARGVAEAIEMVTNLITESRPDEVQRETRGSKMTWRLWWD